jgi:hypothetical protein
VYFTDSEGQCVYKIDNQTDSVTRGSLIDFKSQQETIRVKAYMTIEAGEAADNSPIRANDPVS